LPADAAMTDSLTLGYRSAVAVGETLLARRGTRVRGHEFHRTAVEPRFGERPAWQWRSHSGEGFASDTISASYLHVHWAGFPAIAGRFLDAARACSEEVSQ
ncbi:cobyrinic acid a,c-diamide synthase, partial [Streptomonospora algeriensis]